MVALVVFLHGWFWSLQFFTRRPIVSIAPCRCVLVDDGGGLLVLSPHSGVACVVTLPARVLVTVGYGLTAEKQLV